MGKKPFLIRLDREMFEGEYSNQPKTSLWQQQEKQTTPPSLDFGASHRFDVIMSGLSDMCHFIKHIYLHYFSALLPEPLIRIKKLTLAFHFFLFPLLGVVWNRVVDIISLETYQVF